LSGGSINGYFPEQHTVKNYINYNSEKDSVFGSLEWLNINGFFLCSLLTHVMLTAVQGTQRIVIFKNSYVFTHQFYNFQ